MKTYLLAIAALLIASCSGGTNGRSPAGGEVWTVASRMVDCTGVGPQRCLLIRPDGEADWQFFYSRIDGFDYEPGYEYVIAVTKEKVENPPMDASSLRYTLDRIVSKEKKVSENIPDTGHMLR